MTCQYSFTQIENTNVKWIKWYKNDVEIQKLTNVTINGNELNFSYLNHSIHDDYYKCEVELTNGQSSFTSNPYSLKVHCKYLFKNMGLLFLYSIKRHRL